LQENHDCPGGESTSVGLGALLLLGDSQSSLLLLSSALLKPHSQLGLCHRQTWPGLVSRVVCGSCFARKGVVGGGVTSIVFTLACFVPNMTSSGVGVLLEAEDGGVTVVVRGSRPSLSSP